MKRFETVRTNGIPRVVERDLVADAGVPVHPLAKAFPMIGAGDWAAFVNDVREHGLRQPILWAPDGTLLDGRNRLSAWLELGNDVDSCPAETSDTDDALALIVSLNLARRQLTTGQRAASAARAFDVYADQAAQRRSRKLTGTGVEATEEAGKAFGVGGSYVERARKIMRESPSLFARVESGELTLNQAYGEVTVERARSERPVPGKFDALSKAIKDLDSADMISAIRLMADAAGVRIEIFEK